MFIATSARDLCLNPLFSDIFLPDMEVDQSTLYDARSEALMLSESSRLTGVIQHFGNFVRAMCRLGANLSKSGFTTFPFSVLGSSKDTTCSEKGIQPSI